MLCTDDDCGCVVTALPQESPSRTWDTRARARPDLREKAMAGHGGRVVLAATLGEQEKMLKRATAECGRDDAAMMQRRMRVHLHFIRLASSTAVVRRS